jgi:methylated-DNA-protein-cysteine methyltransferase-like protein
MNLFYKQVYEIVSEIPYGKVISYGQIACMLGRPRSARQVGWAMRVCPDNLPWHRVVKADGTVAGGMYADMRREMLMAEKVPFLEDGRVNMDVCRWGESKDSSLRSE